MHFSAKKIENIFILSRVRILWLVNIVSIVVYTEKKRKNNGALRGYSVIQSDDVKNINEEKEKHMLPGKRAHVIIIGNEKGGSGKTTTAMHITCSLLHLGFEVGIIDLDLRQRSFTRYMENRLSWMDRRDVGSCLCHVMRVCVKVKILIYQMHVQKILQ